ncbi:thioesterase II family protein [Streptomyces xanthochromogenes]|uniref:thioesterase II family protein n=1 Tax=Streptomyces xanthochromogenes TaxID=67384 RepID=UPI003820E304
MSQSTSPLIPLNDRPHATSALILFPYAGGSAHCYRSLVDTLGAHVAAWSACLPGRERRIAEKPFTDIADAAQEMAGAAAEICRSTPTVLFGHSMGGLLAYETVLLLQNDRVPVAGLALSATPAPHGGLLPDVTARVMNEALTGRRVLHELTPWETTGQSQAKYVLAPVMADAAMVLRYSRSTPAPVSCPMWLATGSVDALAPLSSLANWQEVAQHKIGPRTFPGDHAYLDTAAQEVGTDLSTMLLPPLPAA